MVHALKEFPWICQSSRGVLGFGLGSRSPIEPEDLLFSNGDLKALTFKGFGVIAGMFQLLESRQLDKFLAAHISYKGPIGNLPSPRQALIA